MFRHKVRFEPVVRIHIRLRARDRIVDLPRDFSFIRCAIGERTLRGVLPRLVFVQATHDGG